MSNLAKVPQIVSVSPLKPGSPAQKRLERKMTIFPGQKRQTVVLPQPFSACAASPVTSDKIAVAGSRGHSSEEAWSRTSWPPNTVIPVKLWRNPNAVLNDAPTLPVTVTPPCSSPQSAARQPELKCVIGVSSQSAAPSRSDDNATKASSDTILVVKKMQNGRTIISTQGSGIRPPQYLATGAGGSLTQASAANSIGTSRQNIISTLPDRDGVRIAVDPSKPRLRGPAIVFTKKSNVGVTVTKLQNCTKDGSSLASTEMGNTTSSSLHGKRPPAVIRVSPSNPCRDTIRKLLENMHSAPQPNTGNTQPSNQRAVSVSVKPGNCATQVLKEQCETTSGVAQPQASQEQQDESYGFKILSVCSLARKDESPTFSKQVSQVAAGNDGGNVSKATTSSMTHEVCREKGDSAEKAPNLKKNLGSACNTQAGESEQTSDAIELCSFQTKKGNSVIASQIVFKPAPSASDASRNATLCSKSDKLKEAIKLFEESMVQDTDLFSEGEKSILTSLFHRVRSDTLTAESQTGDKCPDKPPPYSSKLAIKAEPTSPDRHTCDSVFNAQEHERLKNLASQCQSKPVQHPEKVAIKAEPTSDKCAGDSVSNVRQEENSATQTAKREHGASASHRPLRRIVITSDEVPMISSDEVKAGIETFLVQNNISNNFCEDEVIKLHWDGKDVSTFHFRDTDNDRSPSPHLPPDVPVPQKIKPNILRCNKPATPVTSADSEASDAATFTVLAGAQTISGTTPPKADTLPEQPKGSTSGPTVPAGYKAVRVKCVADSNQVVLTSLGSVSTTRGNISAEKQLCFMPRAIRYIKKTGEVIEKPLKPGQQVVPVVAPISTKTTPLNQKSTICLTPPVVPVASSGSIRHGMSAVPVTTKRFPLQPQLAKTMTTVVKTTSVPVTASRIVRVNPECSNSKPQSSQVSFPEGSGGSVNMPQATLQRPAYPAVCDDDTSRILEPEVLLEVSNKVIQVQPIDRTRLNASSPSSSSTSSCCNEDWAPPVQTHKKSRLNRKRASSKSSVQQEYRSRKRRRRGNKQKPPTQPLDSKPSKALNDENNVAILSSNCIDRPCVVSMYHLNDRIMTKGFVNLTSVKHKELFALVRTPEVRLAPDKVVSVVQLNARETVASQEVAVTCISESVPQELEKDSLEYLLKEQINHLVHLRKKYQHFSP